MRKDRQLACVEGLRIHRFLRSVLARRLAVLVERVVQNPLQPEQQHRYTPALSSQFLIVIPEWARGKDSNVSQIIDTNLKSEQ